jgi:hypothetical protein
MREATMCNLERAPFVGVVAAVAASLLATPCAANDWYIWPVARVQLGPAIHVAPEVDEGTEFSLDLNFGASVLQRTRAKKRFVWNPEIGYSYDGIGLHAFNATVGIGFGNHTFVAAYHPRLILGRANDDTAVGMRNAIMIHAIVDMFSMEIGHQFVSYSDAMHQDIKVMFGFNPGSLVGLAIATSGW